MSQGTGCRWHEVYRVLHYSLISAMLRVGNESVGVHFRDEIATHPRPVRHKRAPPQIDCGRRAAAATRRSTGNGGRVRQRWPRYSAAKPASARRQDRRAGECPDGASVYRFLRVRPCDRNGWTLRVGNEGQLQPRLSDFSFRLGTQTTNPMSRLQIPEAQTTFLSRSALEPAAADRGDKRLGVRAAGCTGMQGGRNEDRSPSRRRDQRTAKAGRVYQVGFHRDFGLRRTGRFRDRAR